MSPRRFPSAPGIVFFISAFFLALASRPASAEVSTSKFELFLSEVSESVRFYEKLGFMQVHRKADGYTTMRSGTTVVALSPIPWWIPLRWVGFLRRPPLGTEIVFYSDSLEALRSSLVESGYAPGPIREQPWGDRDFRVKDPVGYYIRISEGSAVPR